MLLQCAKNHLASNEKVERIENYIKEINPDATVISTVFRPKPLEDITGKNVLFATTAPDSIQNVLIEHLEDFYKCKVVGTTPHLSNRPLLQKDIDKYIDTANVMLTELKAAAVDVATRDALKAGLEVVYCDNIPIVTDGNNEKLKTAIINVVDSAIESFEMDK